MRNRVVVSMVAAIAAVSSLCLSIAPAKAGGPAPAPRAIKQGPILFDTVRLPDRTQMVYISGGVVGITVMDFTPLQHYFEGDSAPNLDEIPDPIINSSILRIKKGGYDTLMTTPANVMLVSGNKKGEFLGVKHIPGTNPFDLGTDIPVKVTTRGVQELPLFDPRFKPFLINDAGQIVGVIPVASPASGEISDGFQGRVFRVTGTKVEELKIKGRSIFGYPASLSDNGKAVVNMPTFVDKFLVTSVVWEANGAVGDLGTTDIQSINGNGTMAVGTAFYYVRRPSLSVWDNLVPVAVSFSAKGRKDLGLGQNSTAFAVNNSGTVVGLRNDYAVMIKNGKVIDLESSIDLSLGITELFADAISDSGVIKAFAIVDGEPVMLLLLPR